MLNIDNGDVMKRSQVSTGSSQLNGFNKDGWRVVCLQPLTNDDDRCLDLMCVTSTGDVYLFHISFREDGTLECENTCLGNILDACREDRSSPAHSHASRFMEDKPDVHERNITTHETKHQSVEELSASPSGNCSSLGQVTVPDNGPEYIAEFGYRGQKEGYTFWKNPLDGKLGYFRNDIMRSLMNSDTMETPGFDASCGAEESGETESDVTEKKAHGVSRMRACDAIKTFVFLERSKKFLMGFSDPDEGSVFVGYLELDNGSGLNLTCTQRLHGHSAGVLCATKSKDESILATGSYDEKICVWNTTTWECIKTLHGHGGGIKCLNFSPSGRFLLSAASDNTIRVSDFWMLLTNEHVYFGPLDGSLLLHLRVWADQNLVLLQVWSCSPWMCLRHLHGRHEDTTWPVCLDYFDGHQEGMPDGASIVASGSNGLFGGSTLKLFDFNSGNCLATFAQLRFDDRGSSTAIKIVMKGDIVVSAANDGTLASWKCDVKEKVSKPVIRKGFFG